MKALGLVLPLLMLASVARTARGPFPGSSAIRLTDGSSTFTTGTLHAFSTSGALADIVPHAAMIALTSNCSRKARSSPAITRSRSGFLVPYGFLPVSAK